MAIAEETEARRTTRKATSERTRIADPGWSYEKGTSPGTASALSLRRHQRYASTLVRPLSRCARLKTIALPVAPGRAWWLAAQLAGVSLTGVLLVALVMMPQPTLHVLWDMVIPLLPAVFLVNPLVWRSVCPLATINEYSGNRTGRGAMPPRALRVAWVVGIALLFVMVPARRFLLNENGLALAITITTVAVLALAAGLAFSGRAGFCNSICPVLPVEKLYGQAPLLPLAGARCASCTVCTPAGCIDLSADKTMAQTVGPLRKHSGWVRTGFGAFAAAFPGFIIGYFTTTNGDLASAGAVYDQVLGFAAASYGVVAVLALLLNARAQWAMPVLGAAALGLYYWYASPSLAESYALTPAAAWAIRVVMGAAIGWWLWRTLRRVPGWSAAMSAAS
jgi:nitrite reductase (NADH) large subunit